MLTAKVHRGERLEHYVATFYLDYLFILYKKESRTSKHVSIMFLQF
nr:MAG TPA: hypothetical protein [Caudoviricetes sp.]